MTNNSEGTGVGSFRWALNQAEASAGSDRILFSQDMTIQPNGGTRFLFFDDEGLVIDNNGYNVVIDGSLMTGDATWPRVGFWINDSRYSGAWGRLAGNVTITGITIQNAADGGILVNRGAYNITLEDCTFIYNGNEPIRIDGSIPSSDGTQQVTGISVNGCTFLQRGSGILLTQTVNNEQLINYIWSNYQTGILPSGNNGERVDIQTFLAELGNAQGNITLSTNPATAGMVVDNYGNAEAILLAGSKNEITNYGTTGIIVGDHNLMPRSKGGGNSIINYGNAGIIIGSFNDAAGSTSGGNLIINYGYVGGDIWGSVNTGSGAMGGDDTIMNAGIVAGSIYGNDGNDTVIFYRGSVLNGIADGGSGEDTLIFHNVGFHNITFRNFENAEIFGNYGIRLGNDYVVNSLRVTKDVSIHKGVLSVDLRRDLYPDRKRWTIFSGADIKGEFSSIRPLFTSSTLNLRQIVSGRTLDIEIQRIPYSAFGASANQAAVGSALDTLLPTASGTMAELLVSMDFDMNPTQLSATLAGLNPEMYTIFPTAGFETAGIFSQTVSQYQYEQRGRDAFSAQSTKNLNWNVWTRVLGSRLDRDERVDFPGYHFDTTGFVFGADRRFGSVSRAGMLLGYSNGDLDSDESWSGQVNGKHIGLYGSTDYNGFYLDALFGYTSLENSGLREVSTPLFNGTGGADFDSNVLSGSLSGGYDFALGSLRVGPVLSFSYLHLDQDGFSESGATTFNQTIEERDIESLSSDLGVQLSRLIESGNWRFLPRAKLGWLHQYKDDAVTLTSTFSNYPSALFTITGAEPVADQLQLTAGLTAEYGSNLSLYVNYSLNESDEQSAQLFSCGLAWNF